MDTDGAAPCRVTRGQPRAMGGGATAAAPDFVRVLDRGPPIGQSGVGPTALYGGDLGGHRMARRVGFVGRGQGLFGWSSRLSQRAL